jgi:hypothetical protein
MTNEQMTKTRVTTTTENVKVPNFDKIQRETFRNLFQSENTENLPAIAENSFLENFNEIANEIKSRLLDSTSLSDLFNIITKKHIQIAKGKFAIAMILYCIHDMKCWSNLGYDSLGALINDLKDCGIENRQSFYNAVRTGAILMNTTLFNCTDLTYEDLFKNFAKIPYLDIFIKNRNKSIAFESLNFTPNQILEHFRKDTCRDFQKYRKSLQIKIDDYNSEMNPRLTNQENCLPSKVTTYPNIKRTVSSLSPELLRFYRIADMLDNIIFVANLDPSFVEKAIPYSRNRIRQQQNNANKRIEDNHNLNIPDLIDETFERLKSITVSPLWNYTFFSNPDFCLTSSILKETISCCYKEKTIQELSQSIMIYLFSSSSEWKEWFSKHGISNTTQSLADLFDIGLSQCKALKTMGMNLYLHHKKFSEFSIDITMPGLMDKIRNLGTAFKNHEEHSVLSNFKNMSSRQFRAFAKNPKYDMGNEPLKEWVYKKALVISEQYQVLQARFDHIEVFGLAEKWEVSALGSLFRCLEIGKERFDRYYPGLWPYQEDNYFMYKTDKPIVIPSDSVSDFVDC